MKWNKTFILVVVLYIANVTSAICQAKKGQVGFRFLENLISAEAIGRGGIGIVMTENANTVFWNPAGLGWIDGKFDFNINYSKGIADINHSSFAGAINLGAFGVVALDVLIMDYGDFYGTRRANNDQGFIDTGIFSPQAYAFGFSFSQRISNRFSYGVRVKYAKQDLRDSWIGISGSDVDDPELVIEQKSYSRAEPVLDVGAIYDFLYHSIRFGAVIQNVSREIKYEDEKFPFPFAASFSITVDPLSFIWQDGKYGPLIIGFETRHPSDFEEKYKIGAEYHYKDMVVLRSGYMGNYDERGLTFGLGFLKHYHNSNLRFNYAFEDFGIFNSVHTFSFGVTY